MLKRFFKAVGLIVVFGISVCSLYIANLFLMKPLSIDHYLGKNLIVGLVDSPEAMTYLGLSMVSIGSQNIIQDSQYQK